MRNHSTIRFLLPICLVVAALAMPHQADARAGGGSSSGSRGSRTYTPSPSTAAPIQRSVTPTPPPQQPQPAPQYAPRPATPGYYPQPMAPAHPFLSGMAGGLAGMAIGHMLFGSQGMAMGMGGGGMGGGMGSPGLIHFLIVGLLIFLAFRIIRSLMSGGGMSFGNNNAFSGMAMAAPQPMPRVVGTPIQLLESDAAQFSQLFLDIQRAWSANDFARLQQDMTPEMLSYFNEELSANNSRGVVNRVENINIQSMDPVESWHEYNLDYASVKIRWTANDYMAPIGSAAGSQAITSSPSTAQEQWTFVRSPGGRWLLSAIQQMN
jgi:predicted lipid-binding transport protein (Tim44 family)